MTFADEPVLVKTVQYQLEYQEAYEAFLLLATKGSQTTRAAVLAGLFLVGAFLTFQYGLNPSHVEYLLLALLAVATFLGVAAAPSWRAKRGASQVARQLGSYCVGLGNGFVSTPDGERWPLAGDSLARAVETETLFIIRPDRINTFCLPKRILTTEQQDAVRNILTKNLKNFICSYITVNKS
jgi:hypothetical protein